MLDLRDGASTSHLRLRPLITGQPSSVAIGSEKPTTPCKCCASITGRWWTRGGWRGTGTLAPKIHSSRSGLAENLVQGRPKQQRRFSRFLDYSERVAPPDGVR